MGSVSIFFGVFYDHTQKAEGSILTKIKRETFRARGLPLTRECQKTLAGILHVSLQKKNDQLGKRDYRIE